MNVRRNTSLVSVLFMLIIIQIIFPMVIGFDSLSNMDMKIRDDVAFYYYKVNLLNEKYSKEQFHRFILSDEEKSEKVSILGQCINTFSDGPFDSPWPMQCYDLHHTSRSPYSTANVTNLEKWRYGCEGGVNGAAVIDVEGTIYFGDDWWYIHALNSQGILKWEYEIGGRITSAPALADDGTLYVSSWDGGLYAFHSSTGVLNWKFSAKGGIASSPAIADDGTVYFGTMGFPDDGDCNIYAVNPNGTMKWFYHTGYKITSDPAIGDDGTIYIGSGDAYFYAMNPNGTLKWRFKTGHYIKGPPSIAVDGTVYIGSFDGYLYALYPNNGTIKWKCKVGLGTETNPSLAGDGTIYVGGEKLYAVYPNGTIRWTFDIGTYTVISQSSPAISGEGTIYVGTQIDSVAGGDIVAINPNGTERWRKRICNEWIRSSPSIAQDGTVYIGSQGAGHGALHAFGPIESNIPPETPTISGETNGNIDVKYTYVLRGIDADINPIKLYIDWGDGSGGWTPELASGQKTYYEHSWSEKGNYTIRCKAKDVLGEESDWATLEVTMPKTKQSTNWWFLQFLEKHPHMFPIIRQLLGL